MKCDEGKSDFDSWRRADGRHQRVAGGRDPSGQERAGRRSHSGGHRRHGRPDARTGARFDRYHRGRTGPAGTHARKRHRHIPRCAGRAGIPPAGGKMRGVRREICADERRKRHDGCVRQTLRDAGGHGHPRDGHSQDDGQRYRRDGSRAGLWQCGALYRPERRGGHGGRARPADSRGCHRGERTQRGLDYGGQRAGAAGGRRRAGSHLSAGTAVRRGTIPHRCAETD